MIFEIDLALDTPLYEQRVTLDGVSFLFVFDYSAREDRWYFSLYSEIRESLAVGLKINPETLLLGRHRGREGYPKGDLIAVDYSDKKGEGAGFSELGRRVRLMYQSAAVATPATVSETAPEVGPE